jgi:hypothetical protein
MEYVSPLARIRAKCECVRKKTEDLPRWLSHGQRFTSAVYSYPPSTAGQGVMSLRTHELIAELRSRGVAFVIISVCLDESYLSRPFASLRCNQASLLEMWETLVDVAQRRIKIAHVCRPYLAQASGVAYMYLVSETVIRHTILTPRRCCPSFGTRVGPFGA